MCDLCDVPRLWVGGGGGGDELVVLNFYEPV